MTNFPQKQEKSKEFGLPNNISLLLQSSMIDLTTQIKEIEPSVMIGDIVFSARGEISCIQGKPKAGKTSVASIMLAICLTEYANFDTLGMAGNYCEGQQIIYIDTEQSKRSSKEIIKRALRLAELEEMPHYFKMVNIRTLSKEDKNKVVEEVFTAFGKPYLVFVDGIGDLATANDERESIALINNMARLAEVYNTSVVMFLHETPTGDKMRGHLGSECERKCFTNISVSKNRKEQTHTITCKMAREGKEFNPVIFEWDTQNKGMRTIEGKATSKNDNDDTGRKISIDDAFDLRKLIGDEEHVKHSILIERIMEKKDCGRTKAISIITAMVEYNAVGRLEKSKRDVSYFLTPLLQG